MEILNTLVQLLYNLGDLGRELGNLALHYSLLIVWIAWWLWAVNWRRAFPFLAAGAWVPVVLLVLVSALVWSRIAPSESEILAGVKLANFWWQLAAVSLLAGVALFCGWLQVFMRWSPDEINLEPLPVHDTHGHGHDGHGSAHEAVSSHAGHH